MPKHGSYPRHRDEAVSPNPKFPQIEEDILAYWKEHNTFRESIAARPTGENGSNEFVFYDGPPFANGKMHYGHLLTGYVKDLVGRFQTQLGRHVDRRFGWDTHGLPAELEAERILGIEDKSQIEGPDGIGIEEFNSCCRTSVLRYTKEWETSVTRQARWVDFENDYKTLNPDYMESVIWAFKTLYDKGLAYEGYRVLPYCWNDETPLSNHELKMDDDVYQDRQDTTVTVGLRLDSGEYALIWTTTPWTLPANLAVAVGPDIDYVTVVPSTGVLAGEKVIIGKDRLAAYAKELGEEPQIVAEYKGRDLVGKRYYPIFDYFEGRPDNEAPGPNAWQIVPGEFVTTSDGTGLVHIAPAFGEDDMNVCVDADIKAVVPVDEAGRMTELVSDYAGLQVFEANRPIIRDLRDGSGPLARRDEKIRVVLVQEKSYVHSYPHCWRCRQPLIYRAMSSWFVAVTKIRERMVELNQQINWVPEHLRDGQFGKWLEGARDWSISRNRFWGAPIPVWKSDDPNYPRVDVYGSFEELERDFGVEVKDLHRPFIDTLVRPNPDDPTGKSMMRRIPDVMDCWFESGSMPFAQVHYPFENREWFDNHYPGDFIVEYIGQTRGWFYTLHVLATALFDCPAFRSCVSHGIVLGDDGRKMSKSLRNYPDVDMVFDTYGSDAMRWFLMSSPVVSGGNLIVKEASIRDTVRQILLPLWNTYYFFTLYADACNNGAGYSAKLVEHVDANTDVMDRYLLAATKNLTEQVRADLLEYRIQAACFDVRDYLDLLTNWYVRIGRDRFWEEDHAAFDTLYTALVKLSEAAAPLLPLLFEEIWRGLTGGESVHLTDYPQLPEEFADPELVATMEEVRQIVSGAHALRKANKLRVRLPLAELTVVSAHPERMEPFAALIASEVNVKKVAFIEAAASGLEVKRELTLNPREFSPEVRKLTSQLFKAQKTGAWVETATGVEFPEVLLDGKPVELGGDQVELRTAVNAAEGSAADVLASGTFIVLDTRVTPELAAEGFARDCVRAIQDARKAADFHVSDHINTELTVPADEVAAVEANAEMVKAETLSETLTVKAGTEVSVKVEKIEK